MKNIFTPNKKCLAHSHSPLKKIFPFAFKFAREMLCEGKMNFSPTPQKTVFHFSCISPNRMCRKDVSIESLKLLSDVGRKSARVNMRRNKNILQCIIFLQSMSSVSEIKKNSTLSCYPRSDKRKNIKIN